jgi:hypothetical protein
MKNIEKLGSMQNEWIKILEQTKCLKSYPLTLHKNQKLQAIIDKCDIHPSRLEVVITIC